MITASARNGGIYLTDAGVDRRVASGSRVGLAAAGDRIWWLDAGNLHTAAVAPGLTIGSSSVVAAARSFVIKDMADLGTAVAYLQNLDMVIVVGAQTYTLDWPADRSDDFDFDLTADLKKLSIVYRKPGSPMQAFLLQYSNQNQVFVIKQSLLRLLDFELGARRLDVHAAGLAA